jgi:ankyrin repeat protein
VLLQLGASVAARDRGGGTPLFRACFHGHAPVAAALLAAGADILQVPSQSWDAHGTGQCTRGAWFARRRTANTAQPRLAPAVAMIHK